MIKKSQPIKTNLEISQEPNSPVMKLIKQTGIEGIALDVIKSIMSPLINLIRSQANSDSSSSFDNEFNKSVTLIAASDPKNQLELMLATQLAMTHITLGKSAQLLDQNYKDVKTINSLGNLYTKLSRLGIDQINTLERMKGKGQQKIIIEKVNIEAGGQAAIGVYAGVGLMVKKNYKALLTANRFDLNNLPICGAKTRFSSLCKHKGNIRNGRCKRLGGVSSGPINQTFGKDHHRYVHGLRTKEVIIMRKDLAASVASFLNLINSATISRCGNKYC